MFSLKQVTTERKALPPRIIIYGMPKIGKTTFAANAHNPIILDFEGGSNNLEVARVHKDDMRSFAAVMDVLRALYKEEHDYKTVVIDSIDWLERLIFNDICKEYGARSISDPQVKALGYGKGYELAVARMKELTQALDKLREDRGMTTILICHPEVKSQPDPEHDDYDIYTLKLYSKIMGLMKEWSDCILFARQKIHVIAGESAGFKKGANKGKAGERVIATEISAAYLAGNRYNLPKELPLDFKAFWDAFVKATNYNNKVEVKSTATKIVKAAKEIRKSNNVITMGIPAAAYVQLNGAYHNNDFLEI